MLLWRIQGVMQPFFNENYMRLALYKGQNYTRGSSDKRNQLKKPGLEFSRNQFDEKHNSILI